MDKNTQKSNVEMFQTMATSDPAVKARQPYLSKFMEDPAVQGFVQMQQDEFGKTQDEAEVGMIKRYLGLD